MIEWTTFNIPLQKGDKAMGRKSKKDIMVAVRKAEELVASGVPVSTACKQAGTTTTTFDKYGETTLEHKDNSLDAAVDFLIENDAMSTKVKRDTIKTIYQNM